jgi:imidazolonepropionase-like amidohydrolase
MDGSMTRIDADLLIPGRGDPVEGGTVILEKGTIAYAGPTPAAPDTDPESPTFHVPVVLPGLWDAHIHVPGMPGSDPFASAMTPLVERVGRATRDLARIFDGGVTSIRDVGGFGHQLASLTADGTLVGPAIYGSGPTLSQTGGHGDMHEVPDAAMPVLEPHVLTDRRCDGVEECRRAVRLNLREGARLIKVNASGGIITRFDALEHQQFSDAELRVIVEEARRWDRVVAAHAHGQAGIMAALRAGCRTIEHGTYIDDEAIDLMLELDAILVPTRYVVHPEPLDRVRDVTPAYVLEKLRPAIEAHGEHIAHAIERGVRIAAGSDIYEGVNYGTSSAEIRYLVELGMAPLAAVDSMTATGPETLGPQAPKSGQLREGFEADVIAIDFDPRTDVDAWGDPMRVTHVWRGGVLQKGSAT